MKDDFCLNGNWIDERLKLGLCQLLLPILTALRICGEIVRGKCSRANIRRELFYEATAWGSCVGGNILKKCPRWAYPDALRDILETLKGGRLFRSKKCATTWLSTRGKS